MLLYHLWTLYENYKGLSSRIHAEDFDIKKVGNKIVKSLFGS